jgi:multicomponent Na+:H+ antiporter subunit D
VAVLFFIPALNLGGIPPFSGFIGKVALFDAGARLDDPLVYVLIGAGAVTSLLTLYALMRAWNLAFWRPGSDVEDHESPLTERLEEAPGRTAVQAKRANPRTMVGATVGMVGVSLVLTVFAGPLYGVAERAAGKVYGSNSYVQLVFPDGEGDTAENEGSAP